MPPFKKKREREKTVHSTNDDWSRQISTANSGNGLFCILTFFSYVRWSVHMTTASETSMSSEQRPTTAFKLSARDSWAAGDVTARAYLTTKWKDKKKTRKEKKNERRRNPYAGLDLRRYRITSTLRLLCGDPQDEGLRRLQPRARMRELDYFFAGITSTRLHRPRARSM